MRCQNVRRNLSLYVDEMLEPRLAMGVAAHVEGCAECSRELERLSTLRVRLGGLQRAEAPVYLRKLVDRRLAQQGQDAFAARLQDELEYRWSKLRTTGGLWYATRLAGSAVTLVLFFAIYTAMSPIEYDFASRGRAGISEFQQQLPQTLLKNLGMVTTASQRRPISPSDPRINDAYLVNFGENASRTVSADSFSVVTQVDRAGTAKIENVLEYPADARLLDNFHTMLQSARFRPASFNGRAIESHLVLSFSMISVYD